MRWLGAGSYPLVAANKHKRNFSLDAAWAGLWLQQDFPPPTGSRRLGGCASAPASAPSVGVATASALARCPDAGPQCSRPPHNRQVRSSRTGRSPSPPPPPRARAPSPAPQPQPRGQQQRRRRRRRRAYRPCLRRRNLITGHHRHRRPRRECFHLHARRRRRRRSPSRPPPSRRCGCLWGLASCLGRRRHRKRRYSWPAVPRSAWRRR
mmetsp:Transcript_19453/g.63584  ORF Transcript_19453/g.63584 Transcript_19453/m.63584 type:complete len:208 (-) Transcript_19453:919-1542(-)